MEGPDGLSAAAAPHPLSLPKGTPRDGDNFTRCHKPSLFCVRRVSLPLSKPALTSAFVPEDHRWDRQCPAGSEDEFNRKQGRTNRANVGDMLHVLE